MKLPGVDQAVIDEPKVRDYLLSDSHPVGRFKAAFFRSLGYSASAWQDLAEDLRRHAIENEAIATDSTAYGQKYEVHGNLPGTAAKAAAVVSVWIVLHGERLPRLVTAFPGKK